LGLTPGAGGKGERDEEDERGDEEADGVLCGVDLPEVLAAVGVPEHEEGKEAEDRHEVDALSSKSR